ncbi:MAG: ABC transporter ATP-binding protein [Armatimonadota bacterium]|nr:ABC transporter ATP-binding protein [Armatimonadota bacterium]
MITVLQLSYRTPIKTILRRLDLRVKRGETMGVMGMSGTGKSTLLKCVAGLLRPTSGQILIEGVDIARMREHELNQVRRKMGVIFQYAALFDSMTVFENVAIGLRRHERLTNAELASAVSEKLEMVGLAGVENLMPSQLSGGMQKRVGLARALALAPEILLYDEPTAGLDPIVATSINGLIIRMRDQLKVTSIVVSHDLESIFKVSNRVAMMHQGKIVEVGTPDEMRSSVNPYVRQFVEGVLEGPIQVRGREQRAT